MKFDVLKKVVGTILGTQEFKTDANGHLELSDEEKLKLSEQFKFDASFTDNFIAAFNEGVDSKNGGGDQDQTAMISLMAAMRKAAIEEVRENTDEINAALATITSENLQATQKISELEKKVAEEKAAKEAAEQKVVVLSAKTEKDQPEIIGEHDSTVTKKAVAKEFKVNRTHFHNKLGFQPENGTLRATAEIAGFTNKSMGGGGATDTIDVSELNEEFGVYLSDTGRRLDIIRDFFKPLGSRSYMTVKFAIEQYRASKAQLTSVVQQFVAKWTPLGQAKFHPLTIVNRRHKVNLPIVPDDITGGWLTYLYEEDKTPDQMSITKYIVTVLLKERIDDDIEYLMIANGTFEELDSADVTEGQAGQATGLSMDGFITIIETELANPATNVKKFTPSAAVTPFAENTAIAWFNELGDFIKRDMPAFNAKAVPIFVDPTKWEIRNRAYREKFPLTKNEDAGSMKIDDCNFPIVPLENMRGSNCVFCTPKTNFIQLRHVNEANGATKIQMQLQNYEVRIFAEFWLAVGFEVAEFLYAYKGSDESGSGA